MKCLVIGGGGFLGTALCKALVARGDEVVSIARGHYPALEEIGVKCLQHDISKSLLNLSDLAGVDVVFHTAAKVSMWGQYQDFYNINIVGTQNVIEACQKFGIKRLVYTSSPSVISDETDLKGIDESYPYPKKHIAFYPATKMQAEKIALEANSSELFTLALRPHLIWGPEDRNLIPAVIAKAKINKLTKIGQGQNVVDFTFIEDCVSAHLLAAEALLNNPNSRGRAYFISQGEPTKLWDWIDEILTRNNLPKVSKSVPSKLAYYVAALQEVLAKCHIIKEPQFTRFLIAEMVTDHYFNIEAAKRELGYQPAYTMAEAMDKTYPRA